MGDFETSPFILDNMRVDLQKIPDYEVRRCNERYRIQKNIWR